MNKFPLCPARQRLTQWGVDGSKTHVQRCTEQTAEKANQNVTPEDCSDCPVRALLVRDGSEYQSTAKRPAKQASGPLKKDEGGGGYVFCDTRQVLTVVPTCGSCSKVMHYRICDGDKSPHYRGMVTPEQCADCPFRTSE